MVKASRRLRRAVLERRLSGQTQYQIARAAGIHPTTVSSILHDIIPVKRHDERVLALARVLGVEPADAFEEIR